MDKEALKLAIGWNTWKVKEWLSDNWCDLLDGLEAFLKLLLIILRLLLAPVLIIFYVLGVKSVYKQIKEFDADRRNKVKAKINYKG
ncbi:hypothetical protein PTV76_003195 [Acinetobacter baumannii]|uniref:hypothetical protein n=1 Tax=Acinetobacter baumannii TaxID=470 RepID=UPI000707C783|nr:hypothetical protein [Acinetobacter baumannii]EHU1903002.1 hypothetical protein [Acinetobacter baumannii]EKW7786358.1 hypothetical protein [Acinetobacter baumannii]KQD91941.1 hypothetical protein APD31_10345 [Acinetobacter baumannii]KQD97591.1 hypothetical protein APD32_13440 [Acinetobacter baumannii]MBF6794399.1 hypothetical protein [Acinetobacter baumannii]